jgi:hypothetical protein
MDCLRQVSRERTIDTESTSGFHHYADRLNRGKYEAVLLDIDKACISSAMMNVSICQDVSSPRDAIAGGRDSNLVFALAIAEPDGEFSARQRSGLI